MHQEHYYMYCGVDVGLNDIVYAEEATCSWNTEAARGKIRGSSPLARIVWQVDWRKARESQISEVTLKTFPCPVGKRLEEQLFIPEKYLEW